MTTDSVLQAVSSADYAFKDIPIMYFIHNLRLCQELIHISAALLRDMENATSKDSTVRQQLARDIRDACINVGFFYVKSHGIPESDIERAVEAGKRFFDLPEARKLEYDSRKSDSFKGYTALLSENNDPENRGDLHEAYNFGPEDDGSKSAMSGVNIWPTSDVPGFREAVLSYYNRAVEFGRLLFPLFAVALELPEDFFEDKTRENAAIMRVIHYPPQTGPHDDRVLGIGAHSDFECFTILWQQQGVEALQVLNAKNEWISAPPIPGTLVVNIGDQLARWTNDAFRSTVHRAINRTGIERYSIPLFFGVDYNVKLEPIPSCVSSEHPAKYEVITAGEHVKARLNAAYGKA